MLTGVDAASVSIPEGSFIKLNICFYPQQGENECCETSQIQRVVGKANTYYLLGRYFPKSDMFHFLYIWNKRAAMTVLKTF